METKISRPEDIGAAIRARRRALGYTQGEVAGACGMSTRLISELERGRPTVSFDKVLRVVRRLGMDLYARER
ncbi:helix-turn-helix domain-containing protein [Caniella muris]|uniref:helix-turn-helix domain-containing protein n=1 Tax=Caniella muris TaxID=2941502 RepID=UPI00203AF664|nr:helix-turn-helix domain-containing protein [Caniella muris]